jgi:hypothetical protein
VLVDALNKKAVLEAVERAQPDVVIHQMTAIPQVSTCAVLTRSLPRPTAFALKERTIFWRPRTRWAAEDLSHRVTQDGRMSGPEAGSRQKTIPSFHCPNRRCANH